MAGKPQRTGNTQPVAPMHQRPCDSVKNSQISTLAAFQAVGANIAGLSQSRCFPPRKAIHSRWKNRQIQALLKQR
jgi:hypothetical protein